MSLRLSSYVLLGDPAYLAASVASYYPLVDTIVASHDVDGLGWGGDPLDIESSLDQLRAADPDGKVRVITGHYSDPGRHRLESDTLQRQEALDEASASADWVLQLDTDEVVPDLETLFAQLAAANAAGAVGLDFPSLWLYARIRPGRFLASTNRWWRLATGYPGPLAVRGGTSLRHCRQIADRRFRVDIAPYSRDPWQPVAPVDAVVRPSSAVQHFSWIRSADAMAQKARASGHASDFDWSRALARWQWSQRHPYLATALTPTRRMSFAPGAWVRPIQAPESAELVGERPRS